ncbi:MULTISPECIES: hypothetical protein [unclassified Paenibacillus]|uniref:LptM family lipoprotein n=1 Tax=unclassified Paenibacillus TaxID=185978 RepID=UPI001AE8A45F|nr:MULTISPECIES: hypothetical protein [unclassified Paenibacillus]MBP1156561.1 hypothetical protein [Paenibacillus sp. PvP091]MBP1172701.1 hypothetical protein [Paenibacillus sp. PvR098]MBP2439081.1 hypothetical protein [Paenibacillus sp. PvP052]
MKRMLLIGVISAAVFMMSSCFSKAPYNPPPSVEPPAAQPDSNLGNDQDSPDKAEETAVVEEQARKSVQALKEKDMEQLSDMAHPVKGIRFSPYGYVESQSKLVFRAERLKELMTDKAVYEWGVYDGSGEPIQLTFAEYFDQFIYDADFAQSHKTSVNREIGQGTTRSNLTEVYPSDRYSFAEFHFQGFDMQFEGLAWKSLRLVFEKSNNGWYLVGIVHDQWTV